GAFDLDVGAEEKGHGDQGGDLGAGEKGLAGCGLIAQGIYGCGLLWVLVEDGQGVLKDFRVRVGRGRCCGEFFHKRSEIRVCGGQGVEDAAVLFSCAH
ncbi:MAG: hypothetical protein D3916_17710, partial [Candidatus Electrothrix sp. MAN1_4]|nr:hypothetical protein [Candidatus Electrothrix sp. MAN1_4]